MPPILAFDTAHFRATGLYELNNVPLGLSFTFGTLDILEAFIETYYRNPVAAIHAYNTIQERKNHYALLRPKQDLRG